MILCGLGCLVSDSIDWHTAQVLEKLDGSLMTLYRYKNTWQVYFEFGLHVLGLCCSCDSGWDRKSNFKLVVFQAAILPKLRKLVVKMNKMRMKICKLVASLTTDIPNQASKTKSTFSTSISKTQMCVCEVCACGCVSVGCLSLWA
jgi:cobalamin biosynthesis Mg chelatase CobN